MTYKAIAGVDSVGLGELASVGTSQWLARHGLYRYNHGPKPIQCCCRPYLYNVSPDYFRASGTSLMAGRAFTWHDDANAPRVAVVNPEFARKILARSRTLSAGISK